MHITYGRGLMRMPRGMSQLAMLVLVALALAVQAAAQATAIPAARQISPEDLVKMLQGSGKEKPLLLHVGFHVLYRQAHIAGSEYAGAASTDAGIQQLRKRVASLPRSKFIVIYCGCCPWTHCPNVKAADDTLEQLGFTNVKVLYLADNIRTNWIDKGYPVAKGE